MTDKKQPEAPAFCWATELAMTQQPVTLSVTEAREVSAGMQRLHTENTTLQAGYAAARLEVESLQARIKTMTEVRVYELAMAHLDGRSQAAPAAAPTPPAQTADSVLEDADPLQGAANWLAEAHGQFCVAVLQGCLMIGYNRAKRLHDAAIAARKQGANHD